MRLGYKKGEINKAEYEKGIKAYIKDCVEFQDSIGLDVLVHGEPERNDMVEYFGEQLSGFVFSSNAWVQSYGSRCVKPPIIYGDVERPKAMTIEWITYAQSLTQKVMKGMLTGPVTILNWSFVRDDLSRKEVCFGEQLSGFVFSSNAWVQSYGSRCVKPPIIYGDVERPKAMTIEWITYAQSLTQKVMKGMLTGPVTILNWSFVRDDLSRKEVCKQLALCIADEIDDLQKAGIKVIQVDEAAFKEGYPLRAENIKGYESWALSCFKTSVAIAEPKTQIHTHMCYSEFNDIIKTIEALDADVISIETARSGNELLKVFKKVGYTNEVGPGVYDIHSPRIPSVEELVEQIKALLEVLPKEQLWINPDCGLKTRKWEEVKPSLQNIVEAVKKVRG